MKNKKKLYIIIAMLILGILAIVGFSYAYFSGILGTGNDITISSARLGLIYEDGTSEISADTSKPGSIYEKTFKATNESDTVIKYNIEWIDVENTFVVKEELVYRIEKLDGTVVVEETVTPSEDGLIIGGITINPSEVHEYKLIIEFKDLEENSLDNMGKVFNGKIEINTDSYSTEFAYTGSPQTFTAPEDGYYEVELWGASGGSNAPGSYVSGKIELFEGETLQAYVGESGFGKQTTFNNGGIAFTSAVGSGGGATDIRLNNNIKSRIIVAGAGGQSDKEPRDVGGYGGGLIATTTYARGYLQYYSGGGSQISGGVAVNDPYPYTEATNGLFGYGGNGGESINSGSASGGAGYYGGAGGSRVSSGGYPSAGGSSYISGYGGVNSVIETGGTAAQPLHTNNTIHYSGKFFIDPVMLTGAEEMLSVEGNETIGNEGNGKAKITYLGKPTPKKITNDLDNVRYIKDCTNGSTTNTGNYWVEIQAIVNGVNVAENKTVIGSVAEYDPRPYLFITDGDITSDYYAGASVVGALNCVTIDLEQEYDLDEVITWQYYKDGRSFNNHTLSVGATNTSGTTSLSTVLINNRSGVGASSQGFRVSAYESKERKYYNITTETIEGESVLTPTSQSAGDKVAIVSQFTNSDLYGGILVRNADTNEEYLTVSKTETYFIMPAFDIKIIPVINKQFNIIGANVTGGSVTVGTIGEAGKTVSFTTTQSTGYYYNGATVTYSGGSINLTSAQKSFTMPSGNVTITPIFEKYNYSITRATITGGSITSVVESAQYGQAVSFATNQSTGYYYNGATVSYSGGSINLTSDQKSFTMPASNVTITPRFAKTNYSVTGYHLAGVMTASPSAYSATYGQTVSFSINHSNGYYYNGATITNALTGAVIYSLSSSQTSFVMPAVSVKITPKVGKTVYNISGYHSGGVITATPNVSTATLNQTVSFTTSLGTGLEYAGAAIKNVTTGATIYNLTSAQKSFSMPAQHVAIIPSTKKIVYSMGGTNIDHYAYAITNGSSATYGQTVTFTAGVGMIPGTVITGFTVHNWHTGGIIYSLGAEARSFVMPDANIKICPTVYVNGSLHTQKCAGTW